MNMTTFNWALKLADAVFGESDSSKQDKAKKYQEEQKAKDRDYNEHQDTLQYMRSQNDELAKQLEKEGKIKASGDYIEKNPVKANSFEDAAKTGQLFDVKKDDEIHRPAYAQWAQMKNAEFSAQPVESAQKYRDAVAKIVPAFNQYGSKIGASNPEEFYQLTGGNPEISNISQNITAKTGIEKGLPESNVNTILDKNRLERDTVQRGGRLPYEFSGDQLQTIYNPLTKGYTVNRNPDALKLGTGGLPSSLEGMIAGNNSLAGIAMNSGLMDSGAITKNPTEYDEMGRRIRTNLPPKATPNRKPIVSDVPANTSLFSGQPVTLPELSGKLVDAYGDTALNVIDETAPKIMEGRQALGRIGAAIISPFYKKPLLDYENYYASGGAARDVQDIRNRETARQVNLGGNIVVNPATGYPYTEEEAARPMTQQELLEQRARRKAFISN